MSNKKISYTINIDAEISNLESKLAAAKNSISKLTENGANPQMVRSFELIEKSIDKLKTKAAQPITTASMFSGFTKETANITLQLDKLLQSITDIINSTDGEVLDLLPPDTLNKINSVIGALNTFNNSIDKATTETEELTAARRELAKAEADLNKWQTKKTVAEGAIQGTKKQIEETNSLKRAAEDRIATLEREKTEATKRIQEINAIYDKLAAEGKPVDRRKKVTLSDGTETSLAMEGKKIAQSNVGIDEASAEVQGYDTQLTNLSNTLKKFNTDLTTAEGRIAGYGNVVNQCKTKVLELENAFRTGSIEQQKKAFDDLRASAQSLGIDLTGISTEGTAEDIRLLTERMTQLADNGISQAQGAAQNITNQFHDLKGSTKGLNTSIEEAARGFDHMQESANQLGAIESRIKQFISATGVIRFFTSALKNAFSAVKELDSVMTEMAMVTELNVGDYWDQMPEYTKRANELGVSIKGAYESATLFYQQGLNTNEVVALSNQTLKMAKIASLDASEATDRMTAALRGFNMELNETSAQKVADVYSQLAAITASDVDEISTAMTKTASIASSAGMEFETTAAFLAQIIETTRESAETAGTAMKTVIARFQELKKDPAEIGEVDGEIVDANKIETALRSVGVSLRDASGQFRDLDDVFMELAGKWESLDTNTQRYIATIAAGSRQQSRFIAMMSDYGRTQELVGEAQNSAGASNKQYEKSLDSVESKLNQLKNAWTEFTTGIMNSDLVKFFVDLLTNFVNGINQVTQGFDGFTSSISKIGMVIGIFNLLTALVKKLGKEFGLSLSMGAKEGANSLRAEVFKAVDDSKAKSKELGQTASDAPRKLGQEFQQDSAQRLQILIQERDKAKKIIEEIKKNYGDLNTSQKVNIGGTETSIDEQQNIAKKAQSDINGIVNEHPKKGGVLRTMMGGFGDGYAEAREGYQDIQKNIGERKAVKQELNIDRTQEFQEDVNKLSTQVSGSPISADPAMQQDLSSVVQNAGVGDVSSIILPMDEIEQQFKTKMQALLGSTDEALTKIEQEWQEMADKIDNEGMTASQAVDEIDNKLDETAKQTSNNPNQTPQQNQEDYKKKKNSGLTKIKVDQNVGRGITSATGADKQLKKQQKEQKKLNKLEKEYTKNAQKNAKKVTDGYKKMTSSISNVGSTISMVGLGLGTVGNALESVGIKGASETFGKLGNVISTVGGVVSVFGTIMGALTPVISAVTGATTAKTAAETADTTATVAGTVATGADTAANVANTTSEVADTAATVAHTGAEAADTAAEGVNTVATGANTAAKYAQAGGEVAATTAAWPLAIVMLVIVSIIIVLVAIIAVLVALFKKMKAESPEGQLEAAAAAAEQAAEMAEEAAAAYKELKESLAGLKDSYKNLEGLTRGTEEWNDAVEEINSSVLDLVEKYPELASMMTNEGGVLTLDVESEEVRSVLQQYETQAAKTKAAELKAQATVKEKEGAVEYNKLSKDAQLGNQTALTWAKVGAGALAAGAGGLIGQAVAGPIFKAIQRKEDQNQLSTDRMAKALADGIISVADDGTTTINDEEALKQYGLTAEEAKKFGAELKDGAKELKNYGDSIRAAEEAQRAYYQAMAAQAQQLIDASKYTQDEMNSMTVVFNAENMKERTQQAETAIGDLSESEYLTEAKKLYGADAEVDKHGNVTYKDSEGNEKEVTKAAAIEQMAAARVTEEAAAHMEKVPGIINKMASSFTDTAEKAFKNFYKKDKGQGLTMTDVDSLSNLTDEQHQAAWDSLDDDEKEAMGSYTNYLSTFKKYLVDAYNLKVEAEARATKEGFEIFSNMSAEVATEYSKKMQNLGASAGEGTDGLNEMSSAFEVLSSSLSEDDFNAVAKVINSLDWSDAEAWDSLPETFKAMGINVPTGALQNFIEKAKETSNAVYDIDLDKIADALLELQKTIQDILNGEQSLSGFSEEFVSEVTKLDSSFGEKFLKRLDGTYTYVGGTLEDLISALHANTTAKLTETVSVLNNKQDAADLMGDMQNSVNHSSKFESGREVDLATHKDWDDEEKRGYLDELKNNAEKRGIDLSKLGVEGLSNEMDVTAFTPAQIDKLMDGIYGIFQEGQGQIATDVKKAYTESYATFYQNDSMKTNTNENKQLREQLQSGNLSEQQQERYRWQMETRSEVISAKAIDMGVDTVDVDNYNEAVSQLNSMESWYDDDGVLKEEAKTLFDLIDSYEDKLQVEYEEVELRKEVIEYWKTEINLIENLSNLLTGHQRERNQLEREYNKLVEEGKVTTNDTANFLASKLDLLTQEAQTQAEIAAYSKASINAYKNSSSEYIQQFNEYIEFGDNGSITVKTAEANAAFQQDQAVGEAFDEYVGILKDLEDSAREAEEAIYDIEDEVNEISKQGKDDYNSILNEIQAAIVEQQEKAISEMEAFNENITSVHDDLLNKMQEQIDEDRQNRNNQETEKNLADQRTQLSYLSRDTSGSNAAVIAKMQQNLEKQEQQYQDTLIDQSLDTLAQQNEHAAEQREREISLLQAQLEEYSTSKEIWAEATTLLNTGLSQEGVIGTNLAAIFTQLGWFDDRSPIEAEEFYNELAAWGQSALNWALLTGNADANNQTLVDLNTQLNEENIGATQSTANEIVGALAGTTGAVNSTTSAVNSTDKSVQSNTEAVNNAEEAVNDTNDSVQTNTDSVNSTTSAVNDTNGSVQTNTAAVNSTTSAIGSMGSTLTSFSKLVNSAETGSIRKIMEGNQTAIETAFGSKDGEKAEITSDVSSMENSIATAIEDAKNKEAQEKQAKTAQNKASLLSSSVELKKEDFEAMSDTGFDSWEEYIQQYRDKHRSAMTRESLGSARLSETDWKELYEGKTTHENYAAYTSAWDAAHASVSGNINNKENKSDAGGETKTTKKLTLIGTYRLTGSGANKIDFGDVEKGHNDDGKFVINGSEYKVKVRPNKKDDAAAEAKAANLSDKSLFAWDGSYYLYQNGKAYRISSTKIDGPKVYSLSGSTIHYKTGGLADFTGPAWLDGTPSKPEYILNADQTQAFFRLVDVLTGLDNTPKNTSNGDNYFDISINVESISDDYDVEQMAEKIKEIIYEDSMYRNVNNINQIR